MSNTIIREATAADIGSLTELLGQLGYALDASELGRKTALFQSEGYHIRVAVSDGVIAGFIALHIFESFHLPGKTGRITSFCVDEKHRAKGIGSLLISSAHEFFRDSLCHRIEVTSNDRRKDAHQFYVRNGFTAGSTKFIKNI